jgi:hypothetical protein
MAMGGAETADDSEQAVAVMTGHAQPG